MKAIAVVLEAKDKYARVKSRRESACSSCEKCENNGNCTAELVFGKQNSDVELDVYNGIGAKTGDTVELESSTAKTLLIAMLVFVLPVIFSVAAYLITDALFDSIYLPALFLVGVFALSFFIIAKIMNGYAMTHIRIEIVRIVEESRS